MLSANLEFADGRFTSGYMKTSSMQSNWASIIASRPLKFRDFKEELKLGMGKSERLRITTRVEILPDAIQRWVRAYSCLLDFSLKNDTRGKVAKRRQKPIR